MATKIKSKNKKIKHTLKNDRDFNSKKLWKCYSKNLLNG